jgi:site-specific recombinase XerD
MLKLLVRVPLRQRNVREMQLGKHLAKDPTTGHWHLEFRGDELKVGNRGAQVNTYHVDLTEYCPEWLPLLEEFLQVHRPKLPNATTSRYVFLSQHGKPHSGKSLHVDLSEAVAMRTRQRFYPHLVRSIWATEYLEATQDFTTAATMLGDTLGTVMKAYYDVVNKNQHAKARAFLGTALRTG